MSSQRAAARAARRPVPREQRSVWQQIPPLLLDAILQPWFPFVPLIAGCVAASTIIVCNLYARHIGDLPEWLATPPISLTGYLPTTYGYYVAGFAALAVLFYIMMLPFCAVMLTIVEQAHVEGASNAAGQAAAAFGFLLVHAIVPLQQNIGLMIDPEWFRTRCQELGLPDRGHAVEQSLQSAIHQGSAGLFFGLALYHGIAILTILWSSKGAMIGLADDALGFVLKVCSMALLPFPFVGAFLFHPAYGVLSPPRDVIDENSPTFHEDRAVRAEEDRRHMMNMGGVMQWVAVASIALYFMTYGVDFAVLQSRQRKAPLDLARWVLQRRRAREGGQGQRGEQKEGEDGQDQKEVDAQGEIGVDAEEEGVLLAGDEASKVCHWDVLEEAVLALKSRWGG